MRSKAFDRYERIEIGLKSPEGFGMGFIFARFQLEGNDDFVRMLLNMYVIIGKSFGNKILINTGLNSSIPGASDLIDIKLS